METELTKIAPGLDSLTLTGALGATEKDHGSSYRLQQQRMTARFHILKNNNYLLLLYVKNKVQRSLKQKGSQSPISACGSNGSSLN